jgi:hypothetical protein
MYRWPGITVMLWLISVFAVAAAVILAAWLPS